MDYSQIDLGTCWLLQAMVWEPNLECVVKWVNCNTFFFWVVVPWVGKRMSMCIVDWVSAHNSSWSAHCVLTCTSQSLRAESEMCSKLSGKLIFMCTVNRVSARHSTYDTHWVLTSVRHGLRAESGGYAQKSAVSSMCIHTLAHIRFHFDLVRFNRMTSCRLSICINTCLWMCVNTWFFTRHDLKRPNLPANWRECVCSIECQLATQITTYIACLLVHAMM